jgi:glucose-6-phosphate isomerase
MENKKSNTRHHKALLANVFAQTEALMRGRTEQEARAEMQAQGMAEEKIKQLLPYRSFDGNKPSNTLLYKTTDAKTLGALIALYEHKIFVQGVIWNINSFDQWGVELGKQLAGCIIDQLKTGDSVNSHDSSTNALINHYKKFTAKG